MKPLAPLAMLAVVVLGAAAVVRPAQSSRPVRARVAAVAVGGAVVAQGGAVDASAAPEATHPAWRAAERRATPLRRSNAAALAELRSQPLATAYEPALSWLHGCESLAECTLCPPCDPGEVCGMDRGLGRRACVASDCAGDGECGAGWHCRAIGGGVRRCVESGDRQLGGGCDVDPDWRRLSCAEGLECVDGRCAVGQ